MSAHTLLRLVQRLLRHAEPAGENMSSNFSSVDIADDASKPVINLLRGWPNPSLLPVDAIRDAANAVLSDPSVAHPALLYGPDEGYEPCREAIAQWLTSYYRPSKTIEAKRIVVSGGASQSLGCMLDVYTDPVYTRNVWFVAPAYMLAFRIFEDAGFTGKLRAVPEDEDGIDIDFLRSEMKKSEEKAEEQGNSRPRFKPDRAWAKVYKHVLYCVPTFSNPSSRTMTLNRRRELVRLAREYDALVVCDDVYDFLQWPADVSDNCADNELDAKLDTMKTAHLPRVVDVDRDLEGGTDRPGADGFGNVCSNGTFTKIAGPGLRTGWVEGAAKFSYGVSQAGIQRSGGAPSHLTSTYVSRLLETGQIQKHIQTVLRPAYASRYRTMMRAIDQHLLPLGFSKPQPTRDVVGGYFIWLGLPPYMDGAELAKKCQEEEHVVMAPGNIFEIPGDENVAFHSSVRLCFAWEDEPKLSEAIRRMSKVAKGLLGRQEDSNGEYVLVEKNGDDNKLQSFM